MNTQQYFKHIERKTKEVYALANEARAKGFDPEKKVEIPLARSLAERVVGLISTIYPQIIGTKLVNRIIELEKDFGKLDHAVALKIAEEVAKQKFCKFSSLLEAIDAGVRVGFAYITVGVVSSPLEGYTHLEIKKTRKGEDYFCVYYSGPVRSAGGTAGSFSLLIVDHLREVFGYKKYDPTEEEIKRVITEIFDYNDWITNLQYMPSEKELEFMLRYLPIQVDGSASEKREVSNYKNLDRIETNFLRNGVALVLAEGLAQKAHKILQIIKNVRSKGIKLTGWDWLENFVDFKNKEQEKLKKTISSATYISDLVAGRPVLGHPSRAGGFRLRYGKCRTAGLSSMAITPLTMAILRDYVGIGTQLKYEGPGKSSAMSPCDDLDGPIIKLKNGSVVKIDNMEKAEKYKDEIMEVLFLGDFLVNYGEYFNRGKHLQRPGYCEDWYSVELEKFIQEKKLDNELKNVAERIINDWRIIPSFEDAINLSKTLGISLHPSYIFYWNQISKKQFYTMLDWLAHSKIENKIILPYTKKDRERFRMGKRALELIGVEHDVVIENVVINEINSKAFLANLGIKNLEGIKGLFGTKSDKSVLDILNELSHFKIRDKSGTWIGARMGRPEKAKLRKLTGSPNVLFPVGKEGGRLRSVQAACEAGSVRAEFPVYFCEGCQRETISSVCESCGKPCKKMFYCPKCRETSFKKCEKHQRSRPYYYRPIDINYYLEKARENLSLKKEEVPVLIKGVRGTSSENHCTERLEKGILRASYGLQVNKDGTIRYDLTEMPLTHFKPKEIGTSIEKLKELGYKKDKDGNPLGNEDQLIELFPQDIILPSCSESGDEKSDEVFFNVSKYIDELLARFYGQESFYNFKTKEDLIGELVLGLAPHTSAGIVGRIIGFSKTQGCWAHPMWHAAQRRDCEGDETCILLLLDVFLNFSRSYLPAHRGATQDAPLVVTSLLIPSEIDDMAFDIDVLWEYPLELYKAAEQEKEPWEIRIEQLKDRLDSEKAFTDFGFTHNVDDLNRGIRCSAYKLLPTMMEKLEGQMKIAEMLRAVDTSDTARLVIEKHFIKDMKGNLRNFSIQNFRCVACNEIMRRPPLTGVCLKCGGKIIFTTHEGGIKKYLEPALELAKRYNLSPYIKQNLELTKRYIDSVFGKEAEQQEALQKWF